MTRSRSKQTNRPSSRSKEKSTAAEHRNTGRSHQRNALDGGSATYSRPDSESEVVSHPLIRYQRENGNQTVQRMVKDRIQPKLQVGQPNDKYEREADRVAKRVLRTSGPASTKVTRRNAAQEPIQRICSRCQERVEQGNPLNCVECEQKLLRSEASPSTLQIETRTEDLIRSSQEGGRPLPAAARSFFEPRFGEDFDDVRIHTDSQADEAARSVDANAFTIGKNIVFRKEKYAPGTTAGRKLIAHELVHIQQQRQSTSETVQRDEPKSLPGEGLKPPGTCSEGEYYRLKQNVDQLCKGGLRGCSISDSMEDIQDKIVKNAACITARQTIMAKCFKGGDKRHQDQLQHEIETTLQNCHDIKKRKEERSIWEELGKEVTSPEAKRIATATGVGGAIGAVLGGTIGVLGGGAIGGVGGTFAFPGVGTVGGAAAGGTIGLVKGAAIGAAIGGTVLGGTQALLEWIF